MENNWKKVRLGEICTIRRGSSPRPIVDYMASQGMPWVKISDATESKTRYINKTNEFIKHEGVGRSVIVNEGDLILSNSGTAGLPKFMGIRACIHDGWQVFSNLIGIDKEFLYYTLLNIRAKLLHNAYDSTMKNLTLDMVRDAEIMLPTIDEQKAIASILSSVDKKIENTLDMNQTLEQMAQSLFKSWFVDFDPVVDNALDAGFFEKDLEFSDELLHRAEARKAARESVDFKPLPENIRKLFPTAFEKCSEPSLGLGCWVPEGWKPSNVGFEFDVTMGQSPPGSTYNEIGSGLPFFQGKTDFGFRFPSNRIYCTEPKRMAKKYDTLISVRAPVGDINLAAEDCAIGRGLAAARHKSGSISFSYYVMNSLSKYFEVFEGEGTVFGSINQKDFKALPLIKYPDEIITKFDEFCGNWDKRINNLSVEISTLTDLRDTLLPKLISGELRLSNSEVNTTDEVLA